MTHYELMVEAIAWLEKCQPKDPDRDPRVGAVVAIDGEMMAADHRGEEDHAEKRCLAQIDPRRDLSRATVYTTLEPCTHKVRTKEGESCSDRLVRAQVRKVVIGILDPNQGVCGKGLLQLQEHKIEVELFPHDLAQRIRRLNDRFIQAQQSLGLRIAFPENGTEIRGRSCQLIGKFNNPPGDNVVAITNIGDQWWPQPGSLRVIPENRKEWQVAVYFGIKAPHKIYIVKANDLGMEFIEYYRKGVRKHSQTIQDASKKLGISEAAAADVIGRGYLGISMPTLPKGLDMQDCITINVSSLDA